MESTMDEVFEPANLDDCRATRPQAEGYAECLSEGPNACMYALPFGYCFLCHHPRLEEILQHTAQAQKFGAVNN